MAKSLSRIQSQIEKLQKEADAMRSAAIARIRKEMAQLGLTAEDLFGEPLSPFLGKGRRAARVPADPRTPKYADGTGNTWGGIGKRPTWLREALEAGRMLEEFLVSAEAPAPASASAAKRTRKKAAAPEKAKAARARKPAAKTATAKRPARKRAASAVDEAPAAS